MRAEGKTGAKARRMAEVSRYGLQAALGCLLIPHGQALPPLLHRPHDVLAVDQPS